MLLRRRAATAMWTSDEMMLGNDVVDLRDPDSDVATHPVRFDERVFSPRERSLIQHSARPARLRWQLWSAKEAAFKAAKKGSASTIFSPPRFEVEVDVSGNDSGRVLHRKDARPIDCFQVRWSYDADAVHAIAWRDDARRADARGMLVHGFRRANGRGVTDLRTGGAAWGPSNAVRAFAREEIARELAVSASSVEIRTARRVPELWLDDGPADASLSLSHHGEWIAFACWTDGTSQRGVASASQRWAS
jgi:phosphopantetheine--protein transferase-like protein